MQFNKIARLSDFKLDMNLMVDYEKAKEVRTTSIIMKKENTKPTYEHSVEEKHNNNISNHNYNQVYNED